MGRIKDMTGQVFTRLTVLGLHDTPHGNARWHCRCECGNETYSLGGGLRSGNVKSCGCLAHELIGNRSRKHGDANKSYEYGIWKAMHRRCDNPKVKFYERYGGRGIKVCDRWKDYANFIADMGYRPSKEYSIDRIDGDGDYCPSNCKWSTKSEQARNRRTNVIITYQGITDKLINHCERLGLPYSPILRRIRTRNWDIDRAFTQPIRVQ